MKYLDLLSYLKFTKLICMLNGKKSRKILFC